MPIVDALRGAGQGGSPPLIPIVNGFAEEIMGRPVDNADTGAVVNAALRSRTLFGGDAIVASWDLEWLGADGFEARVEALGSAITGVRVANPQIGLGLAIGGLTTAVGAALAVGGSEVDAVDRAIEAIAAIGQARPDFVVFAERVLPSADLAPDYDEVWSVLAHFEIASVLLLHADIGGDCPVPGSSVLPNALVVAGEQVPGWAGDVGARGFAISPSQGRRPSGGDAFGISDWCWGPPTPIAQARTALAI